MHGVRENVVRMLDEKAAGRSPDLAWEAQEGLTVSASTRPAAMGFIGTTSRHISPR